MSTDTTGRLGAYLRDRRTRLDPAALGFAGGRRRTPGLRREEVAQRANISPTWYTWLEQGAGRSAFGRRAEPPRLGADAHRARARAPVHAGPGAPARGALSGGGRRQPSAAARARRHALQPGDREDRHLGRGGLEPRRRRRADRLLQAAAARAQHPAPDVRQLPRPRRAGGLAGRGALRGGRLPRRRLARRRHGPERRPGGGDLPPQPRVRGAVAQQRRGLPRRGPQAHPPPRTRPAGAGVLRLSPSTAGRSWA